MEDKQVKKMIEEQANIYARQFSDYLAIGDNGGSAEDTKQCQVFYPDMPEGCKPSPTTSASSPETVRIKKLDLEALVKASMTLGALNGGGVGNWDGYGESLYEDYGNGSIADEIDRPDFFDTYCKRYVVPD